MDFLVRELGGQMGTRLRPVRQNAHVRQIVGRSNQPTNWLWLFRKFKLWEHSAGARYHPADVVSVQRPGAGGRQRTFGTLPVSLTFFAGQPDASKAAGPTFRDADKPFGIASGHVCGTGIRSPCGFRSCLATFPISCIELLVTRLAARVARHSTHFPSPVNRTFSFVISAWNCFGSRAANLL
jgi:hypothetical protein